MEINEQLQQTAQEFIQQVVTGDFHAASQRFDSTMGQMFGEAKLKETWQQLTGQFGVLKTILATQVIPQGERTIIVLTSQLERANLNINLVFDQEGRIAGLNVSPAPTTEEYKPPAYVQPETFHERDVTIGSGEWALPGTLSLPNGGGKVPGVVLVHGSGPQDRDETVGPNRTFRDLAWGLASQGIAVLRYEKRTKQHSTKYTFDMLDTITTKEEVTDDALLAVEVMRSTPEVDPQRVYLLGHSLGATLAPRIAQLDPSLAGIIIMAGLARPLEDTILDQYTYIYNLSGPLTDAQKEELEQLKIKVARVKGLSADSQVDPKELPLEIRKAYWLDLQEYHPPEVARMLNMRIFVLQGGRDYQVTAAGDYAVWQKALGDRPNAKLKLYPKLYHLFIEGDGPSTPQEYLVEGHVSREVIDDISEWIKQ